MTVHWTLALACNECGATVTWQDEKPEWHEDEERAADIAAAEEWLRTHPNDTTSLEDYATAPIYVAFDVGLFRPTRYYVDRPPTRYTDCPACDSPIYINQHASVDEPDAADAETEEAIA